MSKGEANNLLLYLWRRAFPSILMLMSSILWVAAQNNFMSLKYIDIGKIPERYYIDNFLGCELQVKGWLLAARCKGDRIYIADL